MKNGDQPAFAKPAYVSREGVIDRPQEGLTKREYFAALAMQGIMARTGDWNKAYNYSFVGEQALLAADELLKHLEE